MNENISILKCKIEAHNNWEIIENNLEGRLFSKKKINFYYIL